MAHSYWLYILASKPNGTLYTGVTNDLAFRVSEHKQGQGSKFTNKYGVDRLVYMEPFENIEDAIIAEKRIKRWRRQWKIDLIEKDNPSWRDLSEAGTEDR